MRLAWHIGNRHTDMQFIGGACRIRRDHVLEEMLKGLGARHDIARGAVRSGARRAARALDLITIMTEQQRGASIA